MINVAIVPFYKNQLNNVLFDASDVNYENPWRVLRELLQDNNCVVNTIDRVSVEETDCIIFLNLDMKYIMRAYFAKKLSSSVYMAFEPPVVEPLHETGSLINIAKIFAQVLTWDDVLLRHKNIAKFHYPMPTQLPVVKRVEFLDKKLLTTVVGAKKSTHRNELYSERLSAIRYFENNIPNDFDFYGTGWSATRFSSYRGSIDNKLDVIKNYKFALCYENQREILGYVTEKIFDCFYAGTIPVYWGASNIEDYIPKECYIDRRLFTDYQQLLRFLQEMSESEYNARLRAINDFILSNGYKLFTTSSFADTIMRHIKLVVGDGSMQQSGCVYSLCQLFTQKFIYRVTRILRRGISKILFLPGHYV